MEISKSLLSQVESDLGLNCPFVKGQNITINNCWHFFTNGSDLDIMFYDETDFREGMNRLYLVSRRYGVILLAFVLMDTHVHIVLWGSFADCNAFMHEFIRQTSWHLSTSHHETRKLRDVAINYQKIDTDAYLKTVICYVIKNPTTGGIPAMAFAYPWSSGALYFASDQSWTVASWINRLSLCPRLKDMGVIDTRMLLHTRNRINSEARVIDGIIFPGDYVAYELVQRIFRTHRSYQYFLSLNKDDEIESNGGCISNLSLPIQELRQRKNEVCQELFEQKTLKNLSTSDRVRLAKTLKARYNSSPRQILRVCGLNYKDAKGLI